VAHVEKCGQCIFRVLFLEFTLFSLFASYFEILKLCFSCHGTFSWNSFIFVTHFAWDKSESCKDRSGHF